MKYYPSSLYNSPIPDLKKQIRQSFIKGLSQKEKTSSSKIFFRADDIGVPSLQFNRMINLFISYKVPLCLAVVPAWLSRTRLQALQRVTGKSSQFCWHQHGWLHKNHEPSGKKQEFGPNRSNKQLRHDLINGKQRLTSLLQHQFSPIFTPPWNRCSTSTLLLLDKLQYKGVSRSSGATPPPSEAVPDFQVNVDLHTRKEKSQEESLQNFLKELETSLCSGISGIMLHHQRMNNNANHFLDIFFQVLTEFSKIKPVHFNELI